MNPLPTAASQGLRPDIPEPTGASAPAFKKPNLPGSSTDHEKEAARAGHAENCCGGPGDGADPVKLIDINPKK